MLKKVNADNKKIRVLVVDNDLAMANYIKNSLESLELGLEVDIARNGKDAVDYYLLEETSFPYKAVLTAYNMPHMNGCELAVFLRKLEVFKDIKIVLLLDTHIVSTKFEDSNLFDEIVSMPVDREMLQDIFLDLVTTDNLRYAFGT